MSNEELAAAFLALLTDLHARIDALEDGPLKTHLRRRVFIAHAALEDLHSAATDGGIVQPFSGGDPKPPTP